MPRRSQECRWASEGRQAEIAQLVEHNLAKVGVAGPSPVFRSLIEQKRALGNGLNETNAQVAELVDAHVSGACAARRAGSSPVLGTLFYSYFEGVVSIATWEFESPPLHEIIFLTRNAEIAQLVEHNLAKVGVAGPSPVFRSFL